MVWLVLVNSIHQENQPPILNPRSTPQPANVDVLINGIFGSLWRNAWRSVIPNVIKPSSKEATIIIMSSKKHVNNDAGNGLSKKNVFWALKQICAKRWRIKLIFWSKFGVPSYLNQHQYPSLSPQRTNHPSNDDLKTAAVR